MDTAIPDPPFPPPRAAPRRNIVRSLGSLRITVVLLAFSMFLIFFATLDQVNLGIHYVQEKYFKSFFALAPLPFTNQDMIPMPGGYTIGALLVMNLLFAYIPRLKFAPKKIGIFMIHSGIILLILGQFFTGLMQKETQMRLREGETRNYSESPRDSELAITEITDPNVDVMTVVPAALLKPGEVLKSSELPFSIRVSQYFVNSQLGAKDQAQNLPPVPEVNMGIGASLAVWSVPHTVRDDQRDFPAAFLDIRGSDGTQLGKWLVSNYFVEVQEAAPIFRQPQQFQYQGRTFKLELRRVRQYKPFQLTLKDFSHDRYAGTNVAKNFSSQVHLVDAGQGEDRDVLIFMNNPLRHGGFTFYQAGFEQDEKTTILQVVQNPFWLTPYLACALVTFGMSIQFISHLVGFLRKRAQKAASAPASVRNLKPAPAPAS